MKMNYTITVLSPLHIGTDEELTPREFALLDMFYRVNVDSLLSDENLDLDEFIRQAHRRDFRLDEFAPQLSKRNAAYRLVVDSSEARSNLGRGNATVDEFIKTAGRPFIPGSSLKGALRTAFLTYLLLSDERRRNRFVNRLTNFDAKEDKFAKAAEEAIMGDEPNVDLFRTVKVADTRTISPTSMMVYAIGVFSSGRFKRFRIINECLQPQTRLLGEIEVDEHLLQPEVREKLCWAEDEANALKMLPEILTRYGQFQVQKALEILKRDNKSAHNRLDEVIRFYERLARRAQDGEIVLPLGAGTGWNAKTVGPLLQEQAPDLFERIRANYGMGKRGVSQFPKSRKLVVDSNGRPSFPMGWISLDFERVD